uniref:Apolipoprotein C-IV n=1 Tax=Salarias fasciatus TaxID=181472 RepID=A0A672FE57_SALFA
MCLTDERRSSFLSACGPLLAQTPAPAQPDPPGLLQRLAESARNAKAKIQHFGEMARGFADTYYEDHIQPVAGDYVDWASQKSRSALPKLKTAGSNIFVMSLSIV